MPSQIRSGLSARLALAAAGKYRCACDGHPFYKSDCERQDVILITISQARTVLTVVRDECVQPPLTLWPTLRTCIYGPAPVLCTHGRSLCSPQAGRYREHFTWSLRSINGRPRLAALRNCGKRSPLLPSGNSRLMIRWSRMPNWSSNASRATGRPGRNLCAATPDASITFVIGLREMERRPRTSRRTSSCAYTRLWAATVQLTVASQHG